MRAVVLLLLSNESDLETPSVDGREAESPRPGLAVALPVVDAWIGIVEAMDGWNGRGWIGRRRGAGEMWLGFRERGAGAGGGEGRMEGLGGRLDVGGWTGRLGTLPRWDMLGLGVPLVVGQGDRW